MTLLRTLAWLAAALWLSVAVAAEPDDEEKEGGILGTGIAGTITALGSIVVNGQTVDFDPGLAISDGLTAATAQALLPGHTVAVVAHRDGEAWRAAAIRQVLPLVGPATLDSEGRLQVLGTQVIPPQPSEPIATGDWVAVSGLWQDRRVIASRLEKLAPGETARIEGTILEQVSDRPLIVGDTRISGIVPQHAEIGDVIRAFGAPGREVLEATRLETGLFGEALAVVLVEGYLSPPGPAGAYTLLGSNLIAFTRNPAMIDTQIRQFGCGRSGDLDAALPVEAAQQGTDILEALDCAVGP